MKSAIVSLALFAVAALGQTFVINTPNDAVECQPTLLTWSGGQSPYFLRVLPGGQPSATALEDLGQQNGTQFTWNTNLAAGVSAGLTISDSTGATAQSAAFTIQPGTSTSCLTSSSSSSSGSGTSTPATSTPAGTTTTTPATTPAATTATTKPAVATTTSPVSTPSSGSTTTGASGSAATGAATINKANMGVAGVIGAAIMAILA